MSPPESPASKWTGDFLSKSVLLILEDAIKKKFGGSLRTSLLGIDGELAGRGSVAVDVGVREAIKKTQISYGILP